MTRRALILVPLLLAACGRPASAPAPAPETPTVLVDVTNDRWDDVTIYAVDGSGARRLGKVTAATRARWRIRYPSSGRIGFVVDVFASSEAFALGPEPVRPGDRVEVVLRNHAPLSAVSIAD